MTLTLDSKARLNNGLEIPMLGLGVYQSPPGRPTRQAVQYALEIGYRHIDTAKIYDNEADVGTAVKESGLHRDDIFITTKVWNSDQGYDSTIKACSTSLARLGLGYIDLYLIHWPVMGLSIKTWKAMEQLLKEGKVKAIGVSNYMIDHLEEILYDSDVVPSVNQVEFHPFLYQQDLLHFCEKKGIQLEAYSPLTRAKRLEDPNIVKLAKKYEKTPAQILIRWSLQHGLVVLPKSIHKDRIKQNTEVFDFDLKTEDMTILDSLNEDLQTVFLD
jgi:diketogulonate reductase-like aldo/keto reductase